MKTARFSTLLLSTTAVVALFSSACSSTDSNTTPGAFAGNTAAPIAGNATSAAGNASVAGTGGAAAGSAGTSAGSGGTAAGAASAGGMAGSAGAPTAGGSGGASAGGAGGSSGSGGSAGGPPSTEKFSFFVTSMASMLELAKAKDATATVGFGGDLSYGETGPGAGLRGADKICAAIAEKGMPNNHKRWRAFLSVTSGEDGKPVNAIDRIGTGPWYDLTGRVVAMNLDGLRTTRPSGGDAAIATDLPNEFGIPNHQPNPNEDEVDNHDTLTGSTKAGVLDGNNMASTCNNWTSKVGNTGVPGIGHSWPRSAGQSWISEHKAGGCAPGVNIFGEGGPMPGDLTVGAGGGYGGIYCFSLDP